MMVASAGGATLSPAVSLPLNTVSSAAFTSPAVGWVVGSGFAPPGTGARGSSTSEIVMTTDGGRTWSEQYHGQL